MTINKLNGTECGTEIAKKINTIIDEKASVSLDNLDTDGQAILDGKVNSSDLFDANEHIKINKLQSYSLPSSSYIDLAVGASGANYTAPADGWVNSYADGTSLTFYNSNNGISQGEKYNSVSALNITIPVKKGQSYVLLYSGTVRRFRFIYAVGSQPA